MRRVDYRDFDNLITVLRTGPRGQLPLSAFLLGLKRIMSGALTGFYVADEDAGPTAPGVSTAYRAVDPQVLVGWRNDKDLRYLRSLHLRKSTRLTDVIPGGSLRERRWYRAQYLDVGLESCMLRDVVARGVRYRLLVARGLGQAEFGPVEGELFDRVAFHFGCALSDHGPESIRDRDCTAGLARFDFGSAAPALTDRKSRLRCALELRGLTRAESRVASAFSTGRRIDEVCGQLGVARNTIKTHLKRIYDKLQVGGLPELVYYLGRLSLEVDGSGSRSPAPGGSPCG
jgi:DNA-binding CsgD family transcriptional regulator